MATRSTKAAKTPKAKAATKTVKPTRKAEARPKAAKGKAPKDGKGGRPRKSVLVYEDAQTGERVVAFEEAAPGFMERWRARRAARAEVRAATRERRRQEREAERLRREQERQAEMERRAKEEAEAAERQRQLEEEQRLLREEQERLERERKEAEAKELEAELAAAERRAKAAERREQQRREKESEEARKAEEAIRQAAEEADAARKAEEAKEEAKARRAAEREAKRREMEAEERRKADEQAARDAEEEAERRRLAVQEKLRKEAEETDGKKAKAKPRELEPEMEFQEASKPVAPGREMVPATEGASSGGSAVDMQAELMVAELARRRSKPIVIAEELPEPPKIPKAPLGPGEEYRDAPASLRRKLKAETDAEALEFAEQAAASQPTEEFGFTLPEAFLLLGAGGQWDERLEKSREGSYGGALAGSLLLELLTAGAIMVQRDRFVPTGTVPDEPALSAILDRLRRIREKKGDLSSLQQMAALAKANRELLRPFKDALQLKALAQHGERRHLGLFHRSWLQVSDPDAQERLQNRLRRAIAGGGTPEPRSVLLLGLLDATGQFDTVVPDEAADYNRKRLNGLLGGRDIMGYKVHPQLKALQEIAVRTTLANVRIMTLRG